MKTIGYIIHWIFCLSEFTLGCMFFLYIGIGLSSSNYLYRNTDSTPEHRVAILLGTSKKVMGGKYDNAYFTHRINAAEKLYHQKKVHCFLISGDNSEKYYNEPQDMKNALMNKGIPESSIILDYAGFSTYETVYRAKEIFGVKRCIIISQQFHTERAVWLARSLGIEADGYIARDVSRNFGFLTHLREIPARTLAFWDWMTRPEPKYLGKKEHLNCE